MEYFKFITKIDDKEVHTEIKRATMSETVGEVLRNMEEIEDNTNKVIKVARILAGDAEVEMDTPMWAIKEFGCKVITFCFKTIQLQTKDGNNNDERPNIFSVLMTAARSYDHFPAEREITNEKDRLYNNVLSLLKQKTWGFGSQQAGKTGVFVVKTLCDVLWYLEPFHKRFESRSIIMPPLLKPFTGYRNFKKQEKKIPQLTNLELNENIEKLSELLMLPWINAERVAELKSTIETMVNDLKKYHKFLTGMKLRTSENSNKPEPIRSFDDSWSIVTKERTGIIKDEYKAINQALDETEVYQPIDLINFEPLDKVARARWLTNLELSCSSTLFTYRYGNYLGNINIIWKVPTKPEERKSSDNVRMVNNIKKDIMTFAPRRMRSEFIDKFRGKLKIQPAVLRNMYSFLTEFEYTPNNRREAEIDERFARFLLEQDDEELIYDLRKENGRPCDEKFNPFWEELTKLLDEKSAVHKRRQTNFQYLPFAISVEDLKNQVLERLPEGTPAPSVSWLRLNFQPKNQYVKSAHDFTGRFNVKYVVQQRLLRTQHVDSTFAWQQFKLLKSFAVKWRDYCIFQSLDDKAIVPVGQPGLPVSTGVRSHHGAITANNDRVVALDHDFHVAGIVPSVCFNVDIPKSEKDSFYKGKVYVTVKDKVFQPSNPQRHSAETVKIIRENNSDDDVLSQSPILCRYTDGGPDHRTTYQSVQICCLIEFIALDLDMIVVARTAPSQSYYNPAERVMSVLNLALQNVALERDKMLPNFEIQAKSLDSLQSIRNAANKNSLLKEAFVESMNGPISLLKQRFAKLKWTEEPFDVKDAASDQEIKDLSRLLLLIDPDLQLENPDSWKKSRHLQMFMDNHSRKRHYMFQLKKCTSDTCAYCVWSPPRLAAELFEDLQFVPDSTVLKGDDQFRPFEDIYGTETDDSMRPSIQNVSESSERDKQFKNILVQTKVRGYISCKECGKRRCTYSGTKLTAADERSILRLDEELIYTCGEPLFHAGRLRDVILVKEGLSCDTPIEAAYYAGI